MPKNETYKRRGRLPRIEVVDLFCGIGGLSYGMKSAGFDVFAVYDLDWTCQYAYEINTGGKNKKKKQNNNFPKIFCNFAG